MSGTTLCPSPGCTNPRRTPGNRCTPCDVARQKARRSELRAGAPAKHRVPADGPGWERWARPLDASRLLITSAQNSTDVHQPFFKTLQVAAKHLGAQLVVVPFRYKNPTSIWSQAQQDHERWAPELEPYLFNVRRKLNQNLTLLGDVRIQPTASNPLGGYESLTGAESSIIAHPKMQLRVVPVPTGRYPKVLTTTGCVTKPNFTDTKAGSLGAFHHFLGATLVELDGKYFWPRQLNADRADGSFIDLTTLYTAEGVRPAPRALALAQGDTHVGFTDPAVDAATHGPGGMVETLNPEVLAWHDLLESYVTNPHHLGDPFIAEAKVRNGLSDARAEVERAVQWVVDRTAGRRSVIVPSNHDNFLARWIRSTDWRGSHSKRFYLETALAMLDSVKVNGGGTTYLDPFIYWVNQLKGKAAIKALQPDESFKVAGIEMGMHGDRGPNGARGTLKNLSRLGSKAITGHTHTPGIEEGHYQLGTSTRLKLEYTRGPSSWLNAHCVVYATGKRSLLTIIDGRWRL